MKIKYLTYECEKIWWKFALIVLLVTRILLLSLCINISVVSLENVNLYEQNGDSQKKQVI